MAILKTEDLAVAHRADGNIALTAPLGGRSRQIVLTPQAAQHIGTLLANAGFDALHDATGYPLVSETRLRPYEGGAALLEFTLPDMGGPVVLAIAPRELLALSLAAQAALEFTSEAGEA